VLLRELHIERYQVGDGGGMRAGLVLLRDARRAGDSKAEGLAVAEVQNAGGARGRRLKSIIES
jgi:hypothetical protein